MVDSVQQNSSNTFGNVLVLGAATAGAAGGAAYGLSKTGEAVKKEIVKSVIDKSKTASLEGDSKALAEAISDTVDFVAKKSGKGNNKEALAKGKEIGGKLPETLQTSLKNIAQSLNELKGINIKETFMSSLKNPKEVVEIFKSELKDPDGLKKSLKELVKSPVKLVKKIVGIIKDPEAMTGIVDGIFKNPKDIGETIEGLFKEPERIGETIKAMIMSPKEAEGILKGALKDPEAMTAKIEGLFKKPEEIEKLTEGISKTVKNGSEVLTVESKKLVDAFKPLLEKGFFKAPAKDLGSKIQSAVVKTPVKWAAIGSAALGGVAVIANNLLGGGYSSSRKQEKDIV